MFYLEFRVFSGKDFICKKEFPLDDRNPYLYAASILEGYTNPLFPNNHTISSIRIIEK